MISDWSVELNKGPNPSSSVDQAVSLEDKMEITRKQLEGKLNVLRSLHANWAEMEDIMTKLDSRVSKINQLVSEIEGSADEEKMKDLDKELSQTEVDSIEEQVSQLKDYNQTFSDGNIMKDFIDGRVQLTGSAVQEAVRAGLAIRKQADTEAKEVEADAIGSWIDSTSTMVASITSISELTQVKDQIQVYANQMGSDENLQDKLVDLDAQIRSRKEEIEDMDKNEASIVAQMEKNLEILDEIERNGESALEKPAEYLVAKNVVESIDPTYIRNKELYNQLEAKVKSVLYPPGTLERVQNVELDLDKAELELSRAEVHKVDLSGQTILDAREAVIKIYEVLVEVKNNLEDLIRIKRELTKNDFLQSDADLSSKLVGLRERFNKTGDRITQNKATLSKSLRRVQKLKKALDETDQWASEVNFTWKNTVFVLENDHFGQKYPFLLNMITT